MKILTEKEKKRIWNAVCKEFPEDAVMQEVHFARWMHHEMLENSSDSEKLKFYKQAGKKRPKAASAH